MIPAGVEMLLGLVHDEQFGPIVLVGAGGVHVEALADVGHAIPPFDAAEAGRRVGRLRSRPPRHASPPAGSGASARPRCSGAAGAAAHRRSTSSAGWPRASPRW